MIKFKAALKPTGHPFKISSEGEGELTLVIAKGERLNALPVVDLKSPAFEVYIREPGDEDKDFDFLNG